MAKVLFNLGRWSYLHKWTVIIAWVLILSGVGGSAAAFQKGFDDQFSIPGMPSSIAAHMIYDNFPNQPNPIRELTVYVVFEAPEGEKLADPGNFEAADEVVAAIRENVPQLTADEMLVNPVRLDPELRKQVKEAGMASGLPEGVAEEDAYSLRMLSDDGRYGIAQFAFDARVPKDITPESRQGLLDAMQIGRDAGLKVDAMGQGMQAPVAVSATSEVIGISIAAIVLIITFGSLVAAGLPLLTAVVGIAIGSLLVVLLTGFTTVNSITPVLAVMIGLAVGIDYALFILSRYRAERARGLTRADAVGIATGTAGSSVVFAGLTVIVALAALVIAKVPFLSLMGISAAVTVAIAVLISLTLLPAIMALFGGKIFAGKVPGIAGNPIMGVRRSLFGRKTVGRRWVEAVHRAPGLFLVGAVGILVALSVPAANLTLALPSDSTAPLGSTQRNAIHMAAEGFGPGRNSQMLIVADSTDVDPNAPALQPVARSIQRENPGTTPKEAAQMASYNYALDTFKNNVDVDHVQIIRLSEDRTSVMMMLTPKAGPLDPQTGALISALRTQQDQIRETTGLKTGVTGLIPIEQDITQRLSDAMPLYLSVVIGLAIVLLLLVFRSLTVPLTAGLGFLLSVGAAFGVTVLFWQEGLWDLVHTPGPLVSFIPIFMIGVTFGLAMDYQVFLVSRMREHYTHSKGKPRKGSKYNAVEESVVEGFSLGARVVTAAAIIMIAVFVAFIGQPLAFVKVFGFALGAAVLFDAFFVRMTLIPASMFLLGRATWWMPKWLDRILPSIDVEGTALESKSEELAEAGRAEREAEAAGSDSSDDAGADEKADKKAAKKAEKERKRAEKARRREEKRAAKRAKKAGEAGDAAETGAAGAAGAAGVAGAAAGFAGAADGDAADAAATRAEERAEWTPSDDPLPWGGTTASGDDDTATMEIPVVDAEPVEAEPVDAGSPDAGPEVTASRDEAESADEPAPRRTPFSTPYAERRAKWERARRERELHAGDGAGAGAERDDATPVVERPEHHEHVVWPPQPRPDEPADDADPDEDTSISVQELIAREGGHNRPRRRRALWDPRDYDEDDEDDRDDRDDR